jgi:periplasmic protein TonB
MYAGAVGGSALLGGTINAADKHVKGRIYSYPPALLVTMIAYDTPNSPAFQITAARPAVSEAIVQPAPLASPATMQPAASPTPAAPLVAATPPPAMMLASVGTPRSVEPPVVPLFHVIPEFPDEAARAGVVAGRVRAQLEIDADGNVAAVRIMEAQPGRVFDRAVTETLAKWKFARGAPDRRFEAEIEFRR